MAASIDVSHLQTTVHDLARRLNVDVCTLYLFDEGADELILVASRGLDAGAIGYRLPATAGLTGRAARTRKPFSVKHPAEHPDFHYVRGSGEERFHSFMGLPLMDFDRLLGVMVIQTESPHVFRISEIETFYRAGRELLNEVLAAAAA